MICPKCGGEAGQGSAGIICPRCDLPKTNTHPIVETNLPFHKRYPIFCTTGVLLLITLVIGGLWNMLLITNRDLGTMFWIIPLVPIYFALTYSLMALPTILPPSLLFAWTLDRFSVRVSTILLVNAWTIISVGLFILTLNIHVVAQHDLMRDITSSLFSDKDVVQAIQVFGCVVIPLLWSLVVLWLAFKRKRLVVFTALACLIAIAANISGTTLSYQHKQHTDEQALALQAQQLRNQRNQQQAEQTRKADEAYAQAAANAKQERLQQLQQITFTPYFLNENDDSVLTSVKIETSQIYQKPSIILEGYFTYHNIRRSIRLIELATSANSPYAANETCYPLSAPVSTSKSFGSTCVYEATTSKGIKIYHGASLGGDIYVSGHMFVINNVYINLDITTPLSSSRNTNDDMPITSIVNSLTLASSDKVTKLLLQTKQQ